MESFSEIAKGFFNAEKNQVLYNINILMKTFLIQFLKTAPKNSLEKIIKTYIDFKFAEQSYIESQYKEFSKLEKMLPDFFKKEALEQRFIRSIRKHLSQYDKFWFWGFMKEFNIFPQYFDFFMFMDDILGLNKPDDQSLGSGEQAKNTE